MPELLPQLCCSVLLEVQTHTCFGKDVFVTEAACAVNITTDMQNNVSDTVKGMVDVMFLPL
jgi:hypothetical protein